jgi:hypothetical protein
MRLRILARPDTEAIDGLRLDAFEPGGVYEVGNLIGSVLLAEGWAEPVDDRRAIGFRGRLRSTVRDTLGLGPYKYVEKASGPRNLIREVRPPPMDALDRAADAARRKPRPKRKRS